MSIASSPLKREAPFLFPSAVSSSSSSSLAWSTFELFYTPPVFTFGPYLLCCGRRSSDCLIETLCCHRACSSFFFFSMLGAIDSPHYSLIRRRRTSLQCFRQRDRRLWRSCACGGAPGKQHPDSTRVGVVPSFLKQEGAPFFLCRSVFSFFFLSRLLDI